MKKSLFISTLLLIGIISIGSVSCNMAAPDPNSSATTITFEKNDDIIVTNEVLNIKVDTPKANIEAIYTMKNTKDVDVSTKTMFISPNIDNQNLEVTINDNPISYTKETYNIHYDNEIKPDGWKFSLSKITENEQHWESNKVATINFDLNFKPNIDYIVKVKYDYLLGGRPTRNDDYKYGEIFYYLKPANLWKDFNNIEINLYLDDELPVLKKSSVPFTKVDKNHYQYLSNELPNEDLSISLKLNKWQSFIGAFRNPYLKMNIMMFLPIILLILIPIIIVIVMLIRKHKKHKIDSIGEE